MYEDINKNTEVDLVAIRENVLVSLDLEMQSEIKRLESKAPESEVTKYFLKTLELKRVNKIIELDKILNNLGESIGSLGVISGAEDEILAVKSIETILSPYFEEDEKKKALNNLEELLS